MRIFLNKEVTIDDIIEILVEKLENGGTVTFSPSGTSMLPMLRDGEDVVVLSKPKGRLHLFDIPLYKRKDGSYVLHRIVDFDADGGYVLRGDNQFTKEHGIYDEDQYRTVEDAIKDLEEIRPVYDRAADENGIALPKDAHLSPLAEELRDSRILKNHIITRSTEVAIERFRALEEGQNFHALSAYLKENTYTDVKRTQNTIYLRLKYNEPSGTVVNVRKSMWIHPKIDRAISVREAARLQTFPDSFVFYGTKDKQYQQVGNAVPPIMARAIAEKIAGTLEKQGMKDGEDAG